MNESIKKLTTHNVFESIWFDNQYCINPSGDNTNWRISQALGTEQVLMGMGLEEQFVERVAKCESLPFNFSKSMNGTVLKEKKPTYLAELFYKLLAMQYGNSPNYNFLSPARFIVCNYEDKLGQYRVSENLQILHAIARKLNLNQAHFTGNPLAKIGAEGLLEGELINNLVTELRLAIKRLSFKKKADARKQESKHNFTYSKRYHTHLCKNSPYLYGIRLTLCYWGEETNPASLEKSDNHIQTFLEPLKASELPNSPVGWVQAGAYNRSISIYTIFATI